MGTYRIFHSSMIPRISQVGFCPVTSFYAPVEIFCWHFFCAAGNCNPCAWHSSVRMSILNSPMPLSSDIQAQQDIFNAFTTFSIQFIKNAVCRLLNPGPICITALSMHSKLNLYFVLTRSQIVTESTLQNFAHDRTALLPWHVETFVAIGPA